jgi:hypothetical protein
MQSQEHSYDNLPEAAPPGERTSNTDPREQPRQQAYTYQAYEEGYTGLNARDIWSEGEKLRPEPKSEKSVNGPLSLIVLLCAAFIAGSFFHIGFGWLNWLIVIVLAFVGAGALIANWRIVTIPMPTRTFQVMEHARLVINNGAGRVAIRRGEEGVISVAGTKRASGIGIDPERMQVNYDQRGDTLNISSLVGWSMLQFGLRAVDFEITVPTSCDVQLDNGSGRVAVQGTNGTVRVRTGSGSIQAHDLQGQIAMKTGSGHIESSNLQGQIDLRTGSSRIEAHNLQGQISLRTGSSRIEASNLRGQVTAQTGSGRIDVRQAELNGNSLLKTGSSSITFEGSLDPQGAYNFTTGSGGINVILPADASFNLDAKTGSGGVKNEFGNQEVGNQPRAQLRLRSGSGGIRIARSGMY